jgi:2-amino-4-hydroxy-6-hydroxymethyldihydropteridine diphosphokinase
MKYYFSLGSNQGDCISNITAAVEKLSALGENCLCAPLYKTKPVGFVNQPFFINTVVSIDSMLPCENMHTITKQIEKDIGKHKQFENGPRGIDIDILLCDDLVIHTTQLQIPHKNFHTRAFALIPFCDLNPTVIHPTLRVTMHQLLTQLTREENDVKKI